LLYSARPLPALYRAVLCVNGNRAAERSQTNRAMRFIAFIFIVLLTPVVLYCTWVKIIEPDHSFPDTIADIALIFLSLIHLVVVWQAIIVLWQIFIVRWRK